MSSPSRSFKVKANDKGDTIDIHIGELAGIKAENLGLATWGASVVLADVLYRWNEKSWTGATSGSKNCDLNKAISILELGAGTGLVGLAASRLWHLPVVLTDLHSIVPGIAYNVKLNESSISAYAGSLDWTQPDYLYVKDRIEPLSSSKSKASIILAADTCYTSDHPELISSTVSTWLTQDTNARAIFCYPLRMAYIDHARNLWKLMDARGFVCLEEGKESSEELWGEFEPAPYEWSVWGWKTHHPEAVAVKEADSETSNWVEW